MIYLYCKVIRVHSFRFIIRGINITYQKNKTLLLVELEQQRAIINVNTVVL